MELGHRKPLQGWSFGALVDTGRTFDNIGALIKNKVSGKMKQKTESPKNRFGNYLGSYKGSFGLEEIQRA